MRTPLAFALDILQGKTMIDLDFMGLLLEESEGRDCVVQTMMTWSGEIDNSNTEGLIANAAYCLTMAIWDDLSKKGVIEISPCMCKNDECGAIHKQASLTQTGRELWVLRASL